MSLLRTIKRNVALKILPAESDGLVAVPQNGNQMAQVMGIGSEVREIQPGDRVLIPCRMPVGEIVIMDSREVLAVIYGSV